MKKTPWYYLPIALLLAIASAALQAYSFPPLKLGFIAWVALLPLLVVARTQRPLYGCLCGLVMGLVCGRICGGQLGDSFQYGNLTAAFGSFGLVLAFVMFVSSFCSKRVSSILWPFVVAAAGVTAELFGSVLFPVSISLSQYQNTAALGLASITGVWGVTFLLWLVPAGLAMAYPRIKHSVPALAAAAVVLLAVWMMPAGDRGPIVSVAAVQATDSFDAAEQTRQIKGKPQVIVWPELCSRATNPQPSSSARSARAYVAASFSQPNPPHKPYNAAFVFSPSGKRVGVFRKQHLFGKEVLSFTPGKASDPIRTGSFRTAVPICFDTEFTDVTRDYVRRGAELIVVPNHDPYLPNNMFNYLHMAIIPFRAAENGVPIAWSELNACSAIIDSDGRILSKARPGTSTAITARVHLRSGKTFFTRYGDYFAYACVIALAVALSLALRPPHKPS